jgi:Ca2+-binding RTX toxin-like protein
VDSVSGASSTYHLRLKNVEFVQFNANRDVVDLTAMFKDIKAPDISTFNFHTAGFTAAVNANLEFGFNENIVRSSGAITLSTAAGALVETFAEGSDKVTLSGRTLIINPTSNLAPGTSYVVALGTGAVADTAANPLAQRSLTFATVGNDAPVVSNVQLSAQEDTPVSGTVPAATDKEGQPITYAVSAAPAHGTVTLTVDGKFVYTPQQNYSGADSFSYVASDGISASAPGVVTFSVTPVVDIITGGSADDTLAGNGDADRFVGGAGNDLFSGGGGIDVAAYTGAVSAFQITKSGANWLVEDKQGTQGRDTLVSVERAVFANEGIAFDLDGNAGTAAKLLGAIAGRGAVTNKLYMGTVLDLLDKGMSPTDIASLAINVVRAGDTSSH